MKKKTMLLFVVVCMLLCLLPSVGMFFCPTTETTENKAMAEFPILLYEDSSINRNFFQEFETYFNEHMAFRNPMVYADAVVQTTVFQESSVSGVIDGTNGWLYYTSTLPDYLGTEVMSERQLYNLANNFAIVQDYLDERDIDFVLTIAPNKNTLYGENMPYYDSYMVSSDHSAILLSPLLKQQDVSYLNLFDLFEAQDEVLYLKRDSHWNMQGACLAYNGIMDALVLEHEDYSATEPVPIQNADGDLNRMLYSFYGVSEEDYDYNLPQDFIYITDTQSVEDGWIITENENGKGTLLMFRDSFTNTLIPFLSNEFKTAYYSKGEPNIMEQYVDEYTPDYVVIQKVERNIADYLNAPPILTAPAAEIPMKLTIATTDSSVQMESCMYDTDYYIITGTVDASRIQTDSQILITAGDTTYRAYQTDENGFLLYLKMDELKGANVNIKVYVVNPDTCTRVLSETLELPQ